MTRYYIVTEPTYKDGLPKIYKVDVFGIWYFSHLIREFTKTNLSKISDNHSYIVEEITEEEAFAELL